MATRFDQIIRLSAETSLTVDYLEYLTRQLDCGVLDQMIENAKLMPPGRRDPDGPWMIRHK